MVNILANIIQIIVLAPSPDALLGVDSSLPLGHVTVGIHSANKDGLELVHPGIGEEEGGVVQGDGGGRVDINMLFLQISSLIFNVNWIIKFELL